MEWLSSCFPSLFERRYVYTQTLITQTARDDFQHFDAWYGVVPSFAFTAQRQFKVSCRPDWARYRIAVSPLYAIFFNHSGEDIRKFTLESMDEFANCMKLKFAEPPKRPELFQNKFLKRFEFNDVFDYRTPPPR
uniref:Uncharacterized protein n=1 Tax=Chromera velia CCMP2878 TaxID=1169474 RepID=A0A0G4G795_9ALVE|eukprot:Cvel_20554.t1-p1 / transcript=Cvel_20554.t1 / gene=Cvel_20554 / organism=Chromera_velia_CCMP2878 / gene_product=hypothetical protein / transcript_product=hypothetical protein / location=Cvel_scaffold1855:9505-9903(-) / protein_length=133 / sequence_SO=supercontig / SO=protein_coding / is_pseudo=false